MTGPQPEPHRYEIDTTQKCPRCGADCTEGGELTFWRGEIKWHGPYVAFTCGTLIVAPAARMTEIWNDCNRGKPVINLGPEAVKVGEAREVPPVYMQYQVRFFSSNSTTTTDWS